MGRTTSKLLLVQLVLTGAIFLFNASTQASAAAPPAWTMLQPLWVRQPREQLTARDLRVGAVVAKDASGNYTTIREALDAARPVRNSYYVIYIKKGVYREDQLVISKHRIVLIGDGMGETVITGNRSKGGGSPSSYETPVIHVAGKMFMARDITVENTAGKEAGAAVALRSDSKHSVFYRCEFKGHEDTLLANSNRQFYRECVISGTVDFIYGNAKAVFQSCLILARVPLRGKHNVITAQGREDGAFAAGFSFQNCTVTSHEDLDGAETYLGRPWRSHSHVVFMQSFLDGIVHPSGWVPWNKADGNNVVPPTVYYGEYGNTGPGANLSARVPWLHVMDAGEAARYGNTGPGANLSARVPWLHVMDAGEAARYTVQSFINGDKWLKATGVVYKPGL